MTFNEWKATYKPRRNWYNPESPLGGLLYHDYGEELAFVKQQHGARIWTVAEGELDVNTLYIVAGYRIRNRVGFLVTNFPFQDVTARVRYGETRTEQEAV